MITSEALLKKFNNFKTIPHVAIVLSHMIANENTSYKEFEEVIKTDPTLVLRLLKLVNSSFYSLRRKVKSIAEALVFVGMNDLRNMVILSAIKDIFKQSSHEHIFSRNKLWFHCAAVSICGKMISERIFSKNSEDVFLCGILHDIGIIAEYQVVPELFLKACETHGTTSRLFTEDETDIIGTDHCKIGYLLAKEWKLPPSVQKGIKNHHQDMKQIDPSDISGIIQMADYLTIRLGYAPISGAQATLSQPLAAHIRQNIEEYKLLSQYLPDEMKKAKEIYELKDE